MPSDLPQRLRESTRDLHAQAERSGAMGALLAGTLSLAGYQALLRNLQLLYAELEAAAAMQGGQAWLAGIDLAPLRRGPALAADLATAPAIEPAAPTLEYAARLRHLGASGGAALLAHLYTRYLGDLHGGQVLQRLIERRYPGTGVAFYDFGAAPEVAHLRQALRGWLAAAPLRADEADAVVEEARWSFAQHVRLFEALA